MGVRRQPDGMSEANLRRPHHRWAHKKSLKPKYFPDFFQLTLKRCIFVVSLNLEKV